jgi:hypothetical protein
MCSAFQNRRRQEIQPVIVACGRHEEEREQSDDADGLVGKADELEIVRPVGDLVGQALQGVVRGEPFDHRCAVDERDEECQHAEMPAIVEERQEFRIEARERADAEDDRQHQEGAGAEGANAQVDPFRRVLRRIVRRSDPHESDQVCGNGGEQDRVVSVLRRVPLDRLITRAHFVFS